jgi:ferredoxin
MARTVMVVKEECTSCNLCVEMCPEVFKLNDDQLCEVINPKGAPEDKIQECIDSCPAQCIKWKE